MRLRQNHVGGHHVGEGGQAGQKATTGTGHAVYHRIDHRLIADVDGQCPCGQVHISQSGRGAAADHVAGHDAVDREATNKRQRGQHARHATDQSGGALLDLEILDGAVATVPVERDFPVGLSINVGGQSQHRGRQTLAAQRLAVAGFGVQQGVSHLVGRGHRHHVIGGVSEPGVVKFQFEVLIRTLLIQPQIVHATNGCHAGAHGLELGLGATGQGQGTQLRHIPLRAVTDVISGHQASACRHGERTVTQRLAQGALNQKSLLFTRRRFESVPHSADIQPQGCVTHQGADLGLDGADVFAHHAAGEHNVETPASLTHALHRDFDVVGTEPLLKQRFQLHGLGGLVS